MGLIKVVCRPHEARGPQVAHSCLRMFYFIQIMLHSQLHCSWVRNEKYTPVKGVQPLVSALLMFALELIRARTVSSWPSSEARYKAVRPYWSTASKSQPTKRCHLFIYTTVVSNSMIAYYHHYFYCKYHAIALIQIYHTLDWKALTHSR